MYHGWADPVVPPEDGIQYYESVGKAMGGTQKIVSFFRLFMVPGMGHCNGGPGPNSFDALGALDQWVSAGTAPQKNRRVPFHQRRGRPHSPVVPLPASCHLE